jgi:hypothetical protein
VIPRTLSNQEIIGINGGFQNKGIRGIQLPQGLREIGTQAFADNKLTSISFANCPHLETIGPLAFMENELRYVRLKYNTHLKKIDFLAFAYNEIDSLNLSSCTSLSNLGGECFAHNNIQSLELSACTSLEQINRGTFSYNKINSLDITKCSSLSSIGSQCFYMNPMSSFVLPKNENYKNLPWISDNGSNYLANDSIDNLESYYNIARKYTLSNEDVKVENGTIVSCSYDFSIKNITVPSWLDNQLITGIGRKNTTNFGEIPFLFKSITDIELPNSITSFGNLSLAYNNLSYIDFSLLSSLSYIGASSFENGDLDSINLNHSYRLDTIGSAAFAGNNFNTFTLPLEMNGSPNVWITDEGLKANNGQYVSASWESYIRDKKAYANFEISETKGNVPLQVSFTDLSSTDIRTWQWQFGDGMISYSQNPSHIYKAIGDYTVTLIVSNLEGRDTLTYESCVTVFGSSPIDETINNTVKVYPNPTNGLLYLNYNKSYKAELYKLSGGKIMDQNVTETIDISRLPKGVYILHLINNKEHIVKRIVKD